MLNKIKAKLKTREHAKAPEILSHIWTEALFWVSRAKLIPRTGHKLMIQTLRWVLICLSCWKSTPSACVRLLALHFQFLNFCTWCSRNSGIEMGDCVAKLLCGKTDDRKCHLSTAANEPWLGKCLARCPFILKPALTSGLYQSNKVKLARNHLKW